VLPSQLLTVKVLRRPVESAQYLAIRYTERLAEAGAVTSVGSVGDSYDNALAETIIGLYKTELIRRRGPWKGIDQVEYATLEWVDWFNHRRLLEPIGYVPPAEFEAAYHRQEDPSDPARLAPGQPSLPA
jgi:transposase InsO family protein